MGINGKVLIAQSGGPTAVINQTLAGIVRRQKSIPRYPEYTAL
jgi:6-phosphofructokinase